MPKVKLSEPNIISTTKASQHGTSEPEFLWFPFLPFKKLTVLQGESGIGKSSFILNIAALLSNGESMPFEPDGRASAPGNILYLNNEDDIEEVINPRLIAMGAALDRFHFVNEPFLLDSECKRLENTVRELAVRLVIIDPLTSFLGKNHNMNTAQSVGNLMRALSRIAFSTGSAIVVVCHLTKNAAGKEIDRHLGSSDIMNAARSVLSATRENEDCDVVIVKHLKSTLAKRAKPFFYEIVDNGVIEFIQGEEAISATDEPLSSTKKEVAINTLQQILSNGAKPQPEIKAIFKGVNIGWRTVETAKSELGLEQFYDEDGTSYWRI
ncbi:MAG: AAA family ATPase [Oscillospiraceae bacterium]|nr:AAA family ATPase [Oscillospiraceae bacterium]